MGLGIDWATLFAPVIAKIVEKIVEAILRMIDKWIEEGRTPEALATLAILCDKVMRVEEAGDKKVALTNLTQWAKGVAA